MGTIAKAEETERIIRVSKHVLVIYV